MTALIDPRVVRKIAVLRANAVGDYIVALPALQALRSLFPRAEIVLFGRQWHVSFLEQRQGPVDRVIAVPYGSGLFGDGFSPDRSAAGDLRKFFDSMAREQFDLAFQLHGGGRYSNPFVTSLHARMTVGACTPDAARLDRWIPYSENQHETLRLLEIVSLVGSPRVDVEPVLATTEDDLREAAAVVGYNGHPLVVVNPGSRDPRRRWPPEKFAAVADLLADNGARIIVNGDAGDRTAVQETIEAMHFPAQNVCGSLSLRGLAGLLTRSRLLVSNDSGPIHLANAVGTPAVGIYWCGNVMTYGPVRRRKTSVHVSWRMSCPVCGSDCMQAGCEHRDSFVADVQTEAVAASAMELYQEAGEDYMTRLAAKPGSDREAC